MKNIFVSNFYVLIFSFLIVSTLNAQTIMSDSVFLKNGNTITGRIKDYVPNEYVKIDTKNGLFFFVTTDIVKLSIHTFKQSNLSSVSEPVDTKAENKLNSSRDNVYSIIQYQDTVKINSVKRTKYKDYFPVNLFLVQGSFEIGTIYTPFDVDWQTKFQAIYSRRFIPDYAFGLGACFRFIDYSSIAKVIFVDIRTVRPKLNSFTSVSIDPGIVFYDSNTGFNLNIGYNYARRIHKNLFFTIGVDINYQSNTYASNYPGISGIINPGVSIGLAF